MNESSLSAYGFVCVVFFLKATATAIFQALVRARTGEVAAVEDRRYMRKSFDTQSEDMIRLRAIWNNDHENLPFFFALATAYVLLECWPRGAWIYFVCFAIARIAHSVSYWQAKQPHRFICYALGATACLAMSLHIIINAFRLVVSGA